MTSILLVTGSDAYVHLTMVLTDCGGRVQPSEPPDLQNLPLIACHRYKMFGLVPLTEVRPPPDVKV